MAWPLNCMGQRMPETPSTPPAVPSTSLRLLVADDEESMRHFLQRGLRRLGHQVDTAVDGHDAVRQWQAGRYDAAVLDLMMPDCDGLQALAAIRAYSPTALVLLMTAHGSVATAVQAMHQGAADYVAKPFTLDELWLRLERALEQRRTSTENQTLRAALASGDSWHGIVGQSPAMLALRQQLELVRNAQATVLLTGESGTGKGMVAKALHLASERHQQPFVALNCAAVPDTLVESELFGHEPGAFTGAQQRREGLLQRAHRGTLFLDEIADMSLPAQAKIERFLTEREFVPLGGQKSIAVDVRIVAASNRDLQELSRQGRFRPELLWRLDVLSLCVPPLRERREDIPVLVGHILHRLGDGRAAVQIAPEALGALCAYDWPGNVRELENVLERMVVLAGGRSMLGIGDLPVEVRLDSGAEAAADDSYEAARNRFDRLYFTALLERAGGSITAAARLAGLSRGHLHRRLRELGCDAEGARSNRRLRQLDLDEPPRDA